MYILKTFCFNKKNLQNTQAQNDKEYKNHLDTWTDCTYLYCIFYILFSNSVKALHIHLACRQAIVQVTWLKNILYGFMSIKYIAVIFKKAHNNVRKQISFLCEIISGVKEFNRGQQSPHIYNVCDEKKNKKPWSH